MMRVEVERGALRMWLLALIGIPFVLLGADLFLNQKLIGAIGSVIYGAEDLPGFEPRDRILAGLFVVGGGVLTLWGIKELVAPRKVLVGDAEGIHIAVNGPFRSRSTLPWGEVLDIRSDSVGDEGEVLPVLRLEIADPHRLPVHPWGARWSKWGELLIDGSDWSEPPHAVAASLWRLRESVGMGSEPVHRPDRGE